MKTRILALLFMCFCTNLIFAQNARAILDKASATYTNSGGITAKFTIDSKNSGSKTTYSQDGTAYMKGDKFKIEVPDAITWFDGKTQWVYVKDNDEVNISTPEGEDLQGISPSVLFSMYKQGFDLKYNGEKNVGGKIVQEVELTAQKKRADIKKIIVQINKSTNFFHKIVMYDKGGMENTLKINNYQVNSSLNNGTFTFDKSKYPNTEIVDLR